MQNKYLTFYYMKLNILILVLIIGILTYFLCKNKENFGASSRQPICQKKYELKMYYTDWCGHSRTMLPIFDSLKDTYLGKVEFVKHDCDDAESGKKQCSENGIRFLPTLLYRQTPQSEPVKYSGGPNAENLAEFLNTRLNQ